MYQSNSASFVLYKLTRLNCLVLSGLAHVLLGTVTLKLVDMYLLHVMIGTIVKQAN